MTGRNVFVAAAMSPVALDATLSTAAIAEHAA
jgi:hypothetical protein